MTGLEGIWHLLLRGIFNQQIMLLTTPFSPSPRREIAKKKNSVPARFSMLCSMLEKRFSRQRELPTMRAR